MSDAAFLVPNRMFFPLWETGGRLAGSYEKENDEHRLTGCASTVRRVASVSMRAAHAVPGQGSAGTSTRGARCTDPYSDTYTYAYTQSDACTNTNAARRCFNRRMRRTKPHSG